MIQHSQLNGNNKSLSVEGLSADSYPRKSYDLKTNTSPNTEASRACLLQCTFKNIIFPW